MTATLLFAPRSAAMVPGPQDEALWYARALGWPVVPDGDVSRGSGHLDEAGTREGLRDGLDDSRRAGRPGSPDEADRRGDPGGPGRSGGPGGLGGTGGIGGIGGISGTGKTGSTGSTNSTGKTGGPDDVAPVGGSVDPEVILRWWGASPRRAVRLAAGVHFDVLDVPGAAGTRALHRAERLGLPLGPVAATASGRVQFFVAPGVAEDLPALLDWLDWSDLGLDLRAFGAGDSVPAPSPWPATWLAPWPRAWESARWLRPPAASRLRCAAGATAEALMTVDVRFPDVTRLLSGLADACQQVRLLPRQRRGHDA